MVGAATAKLGGPKHVGTQGTGSIQEQIALFDTLNDTHTHTPLKIKQQTRMMKKGVKHYKLNKNQLINERLKNIKFALWQRKTRIAIS